MAGIKGDHKMDLKERDFVYQTKIYTKKLPPKWNSLYRYRYTKYMKYYKEVKKNNNPLYEIIIEKIAFISVYALYVEAGDYENLPIDNPLYMNEYTAIIDKLVKVLDQLLKYTEIKITASKELELPDITNDQLKSLTDDELNARAIDLISKAKGRIKITATGTKT